MGLAVEIIGWIGAGLILGSYILLTLGKIAAQSAVYQGMNLMGAVGFVINSGWNGAVPSAALNIIWAGIALFALLRLKQGGAV